MTRFVCDETNQTLHRTALRSVFPGIITKGRRGPELAQPITLLTAPMDNRECRSRSCPQRMGTQSPCRVASAERIRHSCQGPFFDSSFHFYNIVVYLSSCNWRHMSGVCSILLCEATLGTTATPLVGHTDCLELTRPHTSKANSPYW